MSRFNVKTQSKAIKLREDFLALKNATSLDKNLDKKNLIFTIVSSPSSSPPTFATAKPKKESDHQGHDHHVAENLIKLASEN